MLSATRVDDGAWHDIQIKWMTNEVWLNLDHGDFEVTQRANEDFAGQYVGSVAVGGLPNSNNDAKFSGCIKVSKISLNIFDVKLWIFKLVTPMLLSIHV